MCTIHCNVEKDLKAGGMFTTSIILIINHSYHSYVINLRNEPTFHKKLADKVFSCALKIELRKSINKTGLVLFEIAMQLTNRDTEI